MNESYTPKMKGHLKIEDTETGEVLVDKFNAIHPQNMSRVIARALSNESNYFIHRMAFGNGGTTVTAGNTIVYNVPNDGVSDGLGWQSTLHNETYSEIIDDGNTYPTVNPDFGYQYVGDPGNANPQPGVDIPASPHSVGGLGTVSIPVGTLAEVRIRTIINANEPIGQLADETGSTDGESSFMFDELGLFTPGLPHNPTAGHQDVQFIGLSFPSDTDQTTVLSTSTSYDFTIYVDSVQYDITITTPAVGSGGGGEITLDDVRTLIEGNTAFVSSGAILELGGESGGFQTHSKFRFISPTVGPTSTVSLVDPGTTVFPVNPGLFSSMTGLVTEGSEFETAVDGQDGGVSDDATAPDTEGERLLTHVIFNPVLKAASRSLTINYTIVIGF